MLNKKNKNIFILTLLIFLPIISACTIEQLTTKKPDTEQIEVQNKILSELEAIRNRLDDLKSVKVNPTPVPKENKVEKPISLPATTVPTENKPTPEPVASVQPETNTNTKLRAVLDKLILGIKSAKGIYAEIASYEKNLENGKETNNDLKLFTNNAKLLKMEVVKSSKGNDGVKLVYTSGDSGKVKIRPNGALSLITTELSKDDDRITHLNGYRLDYTDFHGMASRLADKNYEVQLTGKTQLSGREIYIMKVSTKGKNALDARITHENIGFDPKDYSLRLWEAYTAESKDKPYLKFMLKALEYREIKEEEFKI